MPDQARSNPVSRRTVALALAGGVVGAKLASNVSGPSAHAGGNAPPADPIAAEEGARAETASLPIERRLLSPLSEGSKLLSWDVVAIEPLALGAVTVKLRGESGVAFSVEVLARDASPLSLAPPGRTERFAVHVNNGGDGRMPTAEEQGLAAMALAQIVAKNEEHVSAEGFLTHGARLADYQVALLQHTDGSNVDGALDHRTMLPTDGAAGGPTSRHSKRA
jgi:hypothetical protein